ncbi:efflux RND transporter permease subunit [Sphingomonas panacisoli]|uniref:Efflux RND transporter permease subunit n=1 Tax=Sphingomonas panacisoli TaxID=1813879 RepID=A0A5B8LJ99_9SPHN|nr:efflux RND transporter permease subunit [Sphingomonas panacisoli]QDZ07929.1 efflux RND transporter permease subunit [Sphingomonas panacisoli]
MRELLQRHRRSIWLSVFLISLAGLAAATQLPVTLFPHIDYPRVVVSIDAGERDAQQMEADITRPAEIALREIPGVTQIRSTTSRGSAEVALSFAWGDDMVAATNATQGALATILPDLPTGTRFSVRRSDPTIFPVLGISLTSNKRDGVALQQLAQLKLRPLLSTVSGVAGVDVLGGSPQEVVVEVDPGKMQAVGLTITDVTAALTAANSVAAVGKIEDRHRLYLALVEDRLTSEADIAAVPVKAGSTPGAGVTSLGQIATIRRAPAPAWTKVTSNGTNAVLVNIRQTPTADAVALVKDVEARLKSVSLPSDVKVSNFYDQSELVTGAANSVRDAILLGALLAGVVLFLFLRSWRLMVITAALLPAVLAAACLALLSFKMSFNMMTLGGMAAAVGLVVDDAVVMLEHLMRRLQEADHDHQSERPSMLAAAREMARPLFGSTAATIVVFVPLAFITGVTGGFFKALAVTMVAALAVSLLYARFVLPIIADGWLTLKDAEAADKAEKFTGPIVNRYGRMTERVFARPGLAAGVVALVLVVLGGFAWTNLQSGFMPVMDEGGFILDYKAKSGAALSDTDLLLRRVEKIIRETPEVTSYSRRTGVQLGGGLTEADEGDFFIRLNNDGNRRDIEEVMAEVRQKVQEQVPGLEIETAQLMEDLIGDLTAVPQPIEVKLFGDNPDELSASTEKVVGALEKIQGVVEVASGLRVAGDAIIIKVDRAAAALAGVDPDVVSKQIETQTGGTIATQILAGEQVVDVRVTVPQDLRRRADSLGAMTVRATDGRTVALRQIASISIAAGQPQITREDLAPFIPVTARLEGKDLGSAMNEVQAAVKALNLPSSVRVDYGGLYQQQKQSFRDLATVFVAALLLSMLLLTLLFENWAFTAAVIGTVMLSTTAVFMGLWVTGTELDISALMGLTMVVGMLTELAIFYLAELEPGRPIDGPSLLEAGKARLRPILMSALIAILTLAPLALGLGRGSGLQRPLATAIIFGLAVGAPLVLTILPTLVLLLTKWLGGKAKDQPDPQAELATA